MRPTALDHFADVWCVDFEFHAPPGARPEPICAVATDARSGQTYRLWAEDLARLSAPPFANRPTSVVVAYYASAELGCYRQLGWPFPPYVLDLYAEFRCLTNGRTLPAGRGLLGALTYFGLETRGAVEKEDMRQLAMRGGPWTGEERAALLEYCAGDVDALCRLLPCLAPHLDLSAALLRGRYMRAAACMEDTGVPIDVPRLQQLRDAWGSLRTHLVREIATQFDVYEGESFSLHRFEQWLERHHMLWPRLDSGQLDLKDETFREMARIYPAVEPLRQVRHALSQLRLEELAVGPDGRNRCLLSAFQAKTGRNAPSTNRFVFGPSVWLRHLIRPAPEIGLVLLC
jgi:DNA polymerase-1